MAASVQVHQNGYSADLLHPRARRALGSQLADKTLDANGYHKIQAEIPRSGTATPVPEDAPPSVHATSTARQQLRAQHKKRLFPTVDYEPRVSHFDPRSDHSDFTGFFVLFWVGLAIMVMTTVLRNFKETGYPFQLRQRKLFLANIWDMAFSDLAMTASTALALPLHKLFARRGLFRWKNTGVWIQSAFQVAWINYWVGWPFFRNWGWTAQVFFTLHLLVLFMKMHSYAFYNGHLAETRIRLDELDDPVNVSTAAAVKYPTPDARTHLVDLLSEGQDMRKAETEDLTQLREDLAVELTSPLGKVTYPQNLTTSNFIDYLCCPTLCYELEYPRTALFQPMELFYKTLAVFGCVFLMTVVSEEFIMPVLDEAALRLQGRQSHAELGLVFAETISRLLFPFMVTFLLVFLVIFEYVCGAFAEITCFADRHFYSDWWNSCDWLEFSREWNIPVHNFFRRHVYSASRGSGFSRPVATAITFFVSALAHELVMGCITRKLRGYGAGALMLQMPIVVVQRSPWIRGRKLLNNVLFWCSMISGLAIMCALYVLL